MATWTRYNVSSKLIRCHEFYLIQWPKAMTIEFIIRDLVEVFFLSIYLFSFELLCNTFFRKKIDFYSVPIGGGGVSLN